MELKKASIQRILLIDDDPDDCTLFEVALKEISSSIVFTSTNVCEEILSLLERCEPDLIFLDINLPKVDGFRCLSSIQSSAKHCRIPIVMYSSSGSQKEMNIAYGYGASLFYRKPSRYADLVESLSSILLLEWNRPELIKQQQFREGKYYPFLL